MNEVIAFLEKIGLQMVRVERLEGNFLEGVKIVNGAVHYQDNAAISNLLHEAGHLAIIPENIRHMADGNLDDCFESMFDKIAHVDPEHEITKALLQCSDTEATAWAWAAGKHLGIREETIIRDVDYDGEGESIRLMLSEGHYFGINGLAASGMSSTRTFPAMRIWAQPVIQF